MTSSCGSNTLIADHTQQFKTYLPQTRIVIDCEACREIIHLVVKEPGADFGFWIWYAKGSAQMILDHLNFPMLNPHRQVC